MFSWDHPYGEFAHLCVSLTGKGRCPMIDDKNKVSVPKEVPSQPVQHDADKVKAEQLHHDEKEMIQNQSEKEIDKTLQDSFPASDPPGNY
jgi:hypothetical protein